MAAFSVQEFWDEGLCDWKEEAKIPRIFVLDRKSLRLPRVRIFGNWKQKTANKMNIWPAKLWQTTLPKGPLPAWTRTHVHTVSVLLELVWTPGLVTLDLWLNAADLSRYASWSVRAACWYVHIKGMKAYLVFRCIWRKQLYIWRSCRNDASAVPLPCLRIVANAPD